ncbi:MAG: hypothetical protein ACLFN8_04285 [Candidatus Woesearchaeota archaeon]
MVDLKLLADALTKPFVMFLFGMGFALFLVSLISSAPSLNSLPSEYDFPILDKSVFSLIDTNNFKIGEKHLLGNASIEIPQQNSNNRSISSPSNFFDESEILVYRDRVILDAENVVWASFADTKSMLPVINKDSNALQIVPNCPDDIALGDIVSYRSHYTEGIIIHRVVHIDEDSDGVYFVLKGDNNPTSDPGRIRCSQIDRKVIAIIY